MHWVNFSFKDILTNIDSVIYIDTDILFLSNVRSLWRFFRKFNSTQLAALTPEHEDPAMGWYNRFARHPYYGAMGRLSNQSDKSILRRKKFLKSFSCFFSVPSIC